MPHLPMRQIRQPPPPYSPGTQQYGHGQPPPPYPYPQGTQQSPQNQPPGTPVYPYTGYNQQLPYPMYLTQPMAYMQQPPMAYMQQQPPMSYMHQPPYQMHVYRPEMASHDGICPDVPIGGFSGMLAGGPLDVDMTRFIGSQGGSQQASREGTRKASREGTGSHSGSGSAE
ncbi:hypothetical protein DVH24_006315 [Malus domestica]|uniref:Uncharacterized protein n=1 Tax=Malus domestica TaxID=3750 RepID=A0A498KC06_MALDO|nr:hypothetical protein DVH24_006315 [Malus domestica]